MLMSTIFKVPAFADMHVHLREISELPITCAASALWCDHILIMPNLQQPLKCCEDVLSYAMHVRAFLDIQSILFTFYLTPETSVRDIQNANKAGFNIVKVYPKGRTSHSIHGIEDYVACYSLFREMESLGMTLLLHPEHPKFRSWEGEEEFFNRVYLPLSERFPWLRIVAEHLTTALGIKIVREQAEKFPGHRVATITAHHLLAERNDFLDSCDVSLHCKPCCKTPLDRDALQQAALSESDIFMFGSDSAPWSKKDKFKQYPCAGCFTAPYLPMLLAEVFKYAGEVALKRFTYDNAAKFWGLRPSTRSVEIRLGETVIADEYQGYLPFKAGTTLPWQAKIVSGDEKKSRSDVASVSIGF